MDDKNRVLIQEEERVRRLCKESVQEYSIGDVDELHSIINNMPVRKFGEKVSEETIKRMMEKRDLYISIAVVYKKAGQHKNAEDKFSVATFMYNSESIAVSGVKCPPYLHYLIGEEQMEQKKYSAAERSLITAIRLYESSGISFEERYDSYMYLSSVQVILCKFNDAMTNAKNALDHYFTSNADNMNDEKIAKCYMNITNVLMSKEEYTKSQCYLAMAIKIHKEKGLSKELFDDYIALGHTYSGDNVYEKAMEVYKAALDMTEKDNDIENSNGGNGMYNIEKSTCYASMCELSLLYKEYDKAKEYGDMATEAFSKVNKENVGEYYESCLAYVDYANASYWYEMGNLLKAKVYNDTALEIYEKLVTTNLQANGYYYARCNFYAGEIMMYMYGTGGYSDITCKNYYIKSLNQYNQLNINFNTRYNIDIADVNLGLSIVRIDTFCDETANLIFGSDKEEYKAGNAIFLKTVKDEYLNALSSINKAIDMISLDKRADKLAEAEKYLKKLLLAYDLISRYMDSKINDTGLEVKVSDEEFAEGERVFEESASDSTSNRALFSHNPDWNSKCRYYEGPAATVGRKRRKLSMDEVNVADEICVDSKDGSETEKRGKSKTGRGRTKKEKFVDYSTAKWIEEKARKYILRDKERARMEAERAQMETEERSCLYDDTSGTGTVLYNEESYEYDKRNESRKQDLNANKDDIDANINEEDYDD